LRTAASGQVSHFLCIQTKCDVEKCLLFRVLKSTYVEAPKSWDPWSAWWQVHSEFFTECEILLPLNLRHPTISLRLSSSCLCLLPCLSATSILPSTLPSIKRFRSQLVCKMWPILLAFLVLECFLPHLVLQIGLKNDIYFFEQGNWRDRQKCFT
jgi:hypothetical protein